MKSLILAQDDVQGMEQTMVFSDDSSQDNTPDSIIAEKSPAHCL